MSVIKFSVQLLASSENQRIFYFRAMAVRELKLPMRLSKNI